MVAIVYIFFFIHSRFNRQSLTAKNDESLFINVHLEHDLAELTGSIVGSDWERDYTGPHTQ